MYSNQIISDGTSDSKDIALRIALSEDIERLFFRIIAKNDSARFLITEYPTTCGFAAGFDQEKTKLRSLCEALERWAWSKWIDDKYILPELNTHPSKNLLSSRLSSCFESESFYCKDFDFFYETSTLKLKFAVYLGFTKNGVFPGSRVCSIYENPWDHAIIEAYRNFENSKIYALDNQKIDLQNMASIRNDFFAKNKTIALNSISSCHKKQWPTPEVLIDEHYNTQISNCFIHRSLMKDFIGWHLGSESRFVD